MMGCQVDMTLMSVSILEMAGCDACPHLCVDSNALMLYQQHSHSMMAVSDGQM